MDFSEFSDQFDHRLHLAVPFSQTFDMNRSLRLMFEDKLESPFDFLRCHFCLSV